MSDMREATVEKKVFELTSFVTQGGRRLKNLRVGWESYGRLAADRSNAVLICHYFSGTSHAAGRYAPGDAEPGYWDAIIGPGKAIDTDRYFVLSCDTLVNLNTGDPNTVTTGPASIDPETGRPYGLDFPVVTIRDFVEVQKALVESLGIERLALVAGPSMGSLQTFEWAASHPEMVAKAMPVIGAAEQDAMLIAWLDAWAAPILLDPNWNGGDYYGKAAPLAGLAKALTLVTLQANQACWANATFGRRPAIAAAEPASALRAQFQIQSMLDMAGLERARRADANHFLYLVKANQLFTTGGSSLADGMARIRAPMLYITQPEDLVFPPHMVARTLKAARDAGRDISHVTIDGARGHLDGVMSMQQAQGAIRAFLAG
jgi:homoserine O-acetyltransferase